MLKLHSVKTIFGTSIGAECSNQMQVAQGHHFNADLVLVLPAFSGHRPLQLTLVVFSLEHYIAHLLMCTYASE